MLPNFSKSSSVVNNISQKNVFDKGSILRSSLKEISVRKSETNATKLIKKIKKACKSPILVNSPCKSNTNLSFNDKYINMLFSDIDDSDHDRNNSSFITGGMRQFKSQEELNEVFYKNMEK